MRYLPKSPAERQEMLAVDRRQSIERTFLQRSRSSFG